MDVVLLLIMAAAGLSAVSSHAERQYHFVYEAKTMSEAQRYCREKHTDLATVDSMEVVKLLNDMAGQYNQSAWIGLHDDRDTWKWSMSDPSFYGPGETEFRQWATGQPGNRHNEHYTYFPSGGTGKWEDLYCHYPLWVVCFDVTGPSATFVLIKSKMTWTEAQSYCREHHTDLASVRNLAENQQLVELWSGGGYDAWIGLYRDSWKWSDGSNSSFKYWKVNKPNYRASKVCVAAAFNDSGKWEDLDCGVKKPFICYGPVPVSMQVIKVRVEKPNGVDLNDKAFLDEMLVEAKKNLRAQGLDDNVQLAWRKQPDGQVFQKEEEKKKRDEL
ncbi:C-type mannose receptor 2 [Dissostichus eleginoides]|uniref:C-type mannose receptor 2 n=1 Tax=Dissostichus eleginoides TaxID=100907 RepID=A0AAD9CDD2_DISEL|nr:C-type mannose receptor 2 [Dissostichus eleginoides]